MKQKHEEKRTIAPSLADNLAHIRSVLGQSPDITIREFALGRTGVSIAVVCTDGISDKETVNQFILQPLLDTQADISSTVPGNANDLLLYIRTNIVTIGEISVSADWDAVILSVLSGDTAIFMDGSRQALVCGTRGGKGRNITEPASQVVVRGPRDGFTESIGANVALVRRRIRTPNLWLDTMKIGQASQTDVAMMYIHGVADEHVVQEVTSRLRGISVDGILESGYIEQFIQDSEFTPFPLLFNSERPDSIAGGLLEGRVAVFIDGTPFVLLAPTTFFMFFQSAEDYYHHFLASSLVRLLRYLTFLISLFVPSIYVAAITYHQEMIPTQLLISLATQREQVPFPAFIEVLIMEVTFEILREAGVRMPRVIGQAVSIVGALVLGQAAVEAGIISSAMVIVVSLTGISSFVSPSYSLALAIRLLRFTLIISSAFLGFYGLAIVSLIILGHMCGLRSFGIPYMTPLAPIVLSDLKDTIVRFPWKRMVARPREYDQPNAKRQAIGNRKTGIFNDFDGEEGIP